MICPCCRQPVDTLDVSSLAHMVTAKQERAIVRELIRMYPEGASCNRLQDVLYGSKSNGGSLYADKVVCLVVRRIRSRLIPAGWTVTDARGARPYRLVRDVR